MDDAIPFRLPVAVSVERAFDEQRVARVVGTLRLPLSSEEADAVMRILEGFGALVPDENFDLFEAEARRAVPFEVELAVLASADAALEVRELGRERRLFEAVCSMIGSTEAPLPDDEWTAASGALLELAAGSAVLALSAALPAAFAPCGEPVVHQAPCRGGHWDDWASAIFSAFEDDQIRRSLDPAPPAAPIRSPRI